MNVEKIKNSINKHIDVERINQMDKNLKCRHWVELASDGKLALFNDLVGYTGIKLNK